MRFSDHLRRAFEDADGALDAGLEAELDAELADELEEEFPLGDGTAAMEATVVCPYCAEMVEVGLDPGSGAVQEYVEDCQVCCRPWRVTVTYDADGAAEVSVSALDG